ncbi:MAG: hypothetical protein WBP26_03810 [Candidatus Saccharimonadales bacterium]
MYSIYLKQPRSQLAPSSPRELSIAPLRLPSYELGYFPKDIIWDTIEDVDTEYMMWQALTEVTKTRGLIAGATDSTHAELLTSRAENQRAVAEKIAGLLKFGLGSEFAREVAFTMGGNGGRVGFVQDSNGGLAWQEVGLPAGDIIFEPSHDNVRRRG